MKHFTQITDLGTYDISQIYGNIERIDLDQVSEKIGHISTYFYTAKHIAFTLFLTIIVDTYSETEGYIRDQFVMVNKIKSTEYSGTITDGNVKLEVVVSNVLEAIKINRGQKIEVVGDVQEYGNKFRITIRRVNTLKGQHFLPSYLFQKIKVFTSKFKVLSN